MSSQVFRVAIPKNCLERKNSKPPIHVLTRNTCVIQKPYIHYVSLSCKTNSRAERRFKSKAKRSFFSFFFLRTDSAITKSQVRILSFIFCLDLEKIGGENQSEKFENAFWGFLGLLVMRWKIFF